MGVSRSCTCAMAYMMKTRGWTAVQTMRQFRANRDVRTDDGFMRYIVELDNREPSKGTFSTFRSTICEINKRSLALAPLSNEDAKKMEPSQTEEKPGRIQFDGLKTKSEASG